eukprot:GFUD01027125.1.p1 GENE.GFUD01027125.1~~GFUD01027125.1.p1  ORF type:complete len:266 (-),score=63.86 GFUD01027125.1:73-870(-)
MPGITKEWKLKLAENKLKYYFLIDSYDRSWRNGSDMTSLPFLVGRTEFEIEIYPPGIEEKDRDYVSVSLWNKSDWKVKVEMEVEVGKEKVSSTEKILSEKGRNTYVCVDLWKDEDAIDVDGVLAVSATISLVWGEVTGARNNSEISLKECKAEVEGLRSEVGDLKTKIESLEANQASKMTQLNKNLTAKFKTLEVSSKKSSLPGPECPICFEEMKPPTRIIQCRSGHLVCQECKERPQVVICPTCKQEFTGRAIGMENYLKTILG